MMKNDSKNRISIFCYYDAEGVFGNDSIYLTKELKKVSSKLIIVVNGELKNKEDISFADRIIVRENVGYDIGAYKMAIMDPEINSMIRNADELVLCNSSFYGPFVPFSEIFDEAEKYDWDFFGLSKNTTGTNNHIQSYFIVYRKSVIESECFYKYFDYIDETKENHNTSCALFENGFLNYLVYHGYRWGALRNISYNSFKNPLESLEIDRIPLLKKKVFENQKKASILAGFVLAYLRDNTNYDLSLLTDNVQRKYGYDIQYENIKDTKIKELTAISILNNNTISKSLKGFIEKQDSVFIYGCGDLAGRIYSSFFFYTQYRDCLSGFIISDDRDMETMSFFGYPVYHLCEIEDKESAIIVALNHNNTDEVKHSLSEFNKVFYIAQDINDIDIHKFSSSIFNECKNGETPVIRGFRGKGKHIIDCFKKTKIEYVICDADKDLHDKNIEGYGIIRSQSWVKEHVKNPAFFITSEERFDVIFNELEEQYPLAQKININKIMDMCKKMDDRENLGVGRIREAFFGSGKWFDGRRFHEMIDPHTIELYNLIEIEKTRFLDTFIPKNNRENKYGVTICAIFKDEALYLKEWVDYHIEIGIEHFYLYNNNSSDNYREILKPYIDSNIITLVDWTKDHAQLEAYEDCIIRHRNECDWIGFIDLDEFVVIKDGRSIGEFLKQFKKNRPAVVLYWKVFGSNGYDERDMSVPVTEAFHSCNPMFNTNGKCFYNTSYEFDKAVCTMDSFHHRLFAKCDGVVLPPVNVYNHVSYRAWNIVDKLDFPAWINHYAIKSRKEYAVRMKKTDVFFEKNKHDMYYFNYYDVRSTAYDYTIQKLRNRK